MKGDRGKAIRENLPKISITLVILPKSDNSSYKMNISREKDILAKKEQTKGEKSLKFPKYLILFPSLPKPFMSNLWVIYIYSFSG